MKIDYQKKISEITTWLKNTVHSAGFQDVLIAVSGGIDSAVATALAVKALGKEHVYALLMPNGKMSAEATLHAKLLLHSLGIPKNHIVQRDISKIIRKFGLNSDGTQKSGTSDTQIFRTSDTPEHRVLSESHLDRLRLGNIMARLRMIFLYDLAKSLNALVIGTENKSEYHLGYFTRFGDEASDIEPIRNLYKTQIFEMAKILGIPQEIIVKPPTAGLWEGQTDEKEFGFSYKDADRILYHYFDEGLPEEGIVALGIEKKIVQEVLQRVKDNDFKHKLPKVFEK